MDEESLYDYRTPFESPDRIRLGDKTNGNFSSQTYDTELKRHKIDLYSSSALVGSWALGADGLITFNGDPASGGGGSSLSQADLDAIHVVENNIAAVLSVQDNITEIDAVAAAIADGTFDDLSQAALAAETAEAAKLAAQAAEANAGSSALASGTSATAANASAVAGAQHESAAAASEALAQQWATAPADTEIEPGLKSSRAYAQAAQSFGRAIGAIPSRELTAASYTLAKTSTVARGDEFGALYCTGATNKVIDLPRDFNTTAAVDGSPGWVPVRIIRTGAGTVTLQGAGGTTVTNPSVTGEWQAIYKAPDPPSSTTTTQVRAITVPAGVKRFLFVTAAEINLNTTTHTMSLAASTGTVTARTAATAPAGSLTTAPEVNGQSWTVALADSASAATNVDLTFTLPANSTSFCYKVWAAKDVNAISGATGNSTSTDVTTQSISVTGTTNGLCLATIVAQGNGTPATMTGGTPSTAIFSGSGQRDVTIITAYKTPASAGSNTFSATFAHNSQHALLGINFEAGGGGGTAVSVLGTPLTVGSNSWADVMALSDGTTYIVRHGT